jgi:16S rRNA (cytosine1402-N4)-methyltransferase
MMQGGGEPTDLAAGGPAHHIPVLLSEVMDALNLQPGGLYLDGTFGAGGYTRNMLERANVRVLALDRDPRAIKASGPMQQAFGDRLILRHSRFSQFQKIAIEAGLAAPGQPAFDGITLDIGVSSMQIDEAERGFSFKQDGPLDMRMEGTGRSAADLVNSASAEELADIFFHYGEERAARRIAKAIVHDRATTPFTSTRQLAELIARLLPSKPHEIHPATRTFQALRIAVNVELEELVEALIAAEAALKPGGRLAIVSFHSLEDRIVKQFLADRSDRGRASSRLLPGEQAPPAPTFDQISRHPVIAGEAELARNPRARSAKLRFATRTKAPVRGLDSKLMSLALLPASDLKRR